MRTIKTLSVYSLFLFILLSCSTESTPVYQLTTSVEPVGAGSIEPNQGEYDEGETVELKANAADNWIFNGWQGDLTGNVNPATITMSTDKTIMASFKKMEFSLNVDITGEGKVEEVLVQAKSTDYPLGSKVRLTAMPESGWMFSNWEGDLSGTNTSKEIVVNEEKNVTAVFVRQEYTLNINIIGEGEVDQSIIQEKTDYVGGTRVSITALPDNGWFFSNWEGDVTGTDISKEITINEDLEVTAIFDEGVKDIDNNAYKIVTIFDQTWMAENLETTKYRDGSSIPNISSSTDWDNNESIGAWAYYLSDQSYNSVYGKLYNWFAVNDDRGLCPAGWRIPEKRDLDRLMNNLGNNPGGKLKAEGTQYWSSPNTGANNESGFTALPGGKRESDGEFNSLTLGGYWWSSTEQDNNNAWLLTLNHSSDNMIIDSRKKVLGRSVRCIKD